MYDVRFMTQPAVLVKWNIKHSFCPSLTNVQRGHARLGARIPETTSGEPITTNVQQRLGPLPLLCVPCQGN